MEWRTCFRTIECIIRACSTSMSLCISVLQWVLFWETTTGASLFSKCSWAWSIQARCDAGYMLSVLATNSSWVHSEELLSHKQLQLSKCLHWKQTFRMKKPIHTSSPLRWICCKVTSWKKSYWPSAKVIQQSLEQRSDWYSSLYTAPNMSTKLPSFNSVELQDGGNMVHCRAWSSSSFKVTKTNSEDVGVACLFPLQFSTRMAMKQMRCVL